MMQPTFRPATKADAAALAVLVDIAGEGMACHMWQGLAAPGQSAVEIGRERARRDEGGFSYRNATIAEIGGEIAACLVGYRLDDPYDLDASLAETPEIVRPLIRLEAKAPGSWYVNVLATFPEFRRVGHCRPAARNRRGEGLRGAGAGLERDRRELERTRRAPLRKRGLCRARPRARAALSRLPAPRRLGAAGQAARGVRRRMHWPEAKLLFALFAAGALSFLAGFAYVELIGRLPCSGETLVCNINEAVGAYGVIIWAILGPLIFALVLTIARNRKGTPRRGACAAGSAGCLFAPYPDRTRHLYGLRAQPAVQDLSR